jgi:hypothetical protein
MSEGQHVSDDQLSPQERLALLGLMAVARTSDGIRTGVALHVVPSVPADHS